jgi:hypothetical protein
MFFVYAGFADNADAAKEPDVASWPEKAFTCNFSYTS